jgi:penicillin-binding protein A
VVPEASIKVSYRWEEGRCATRLSACGVHRKHLNDVEVAGKTGTAQNPHGENHAWFITYAPYDDPEIAFAIMVPYASTDFNVTGGVSTRIGDEVMDAYFGLKEKRAQGQPKLEDQQSEDNEETE